MIHPRHTFDDNGQPQVFRFFDELPPEQQDVLTRQASAIDLEELNRLYETLIRNESGHDESAAGNLEPASYIPLPRNGGNPADWAQAREVGEAALRAGRVAAFTVAGGQGTRLGYDGPKGSYPVTPIRQATLFQVFAEKIRAAGERYGKPISWFIMTSEVNHDATVAFFEENDYFSLDPDRVHLFSQGLMPAVDEEGKILLDQNGSIALSPDGHGGSLRALVRSGSIEKMDADGIDVISYFQVDNPLVRCIDPEFIGFHLLNGSELSSKTVPKAYPEEKVGVFCELDGQSVVVEYSDLSDELTQARDENGGIRFRAGNIAIHIFSREFVNRIGSGADPDAALPFHRAHKKVPFVDKSGNRIEPDDPNAWKFEMFVFDALPFAKNPVLIETAREDDFSPVKNAKGTDSAQTCRDDQLRQFARWVNAAGVEIEIDDSGLPPFAFEVSPLFAETEERFVEKWEALESKPEICEGIVIG